MTESRAAMLHRVARELMDLADQDLGDGQPAEPLTATRLFHAHETLLALHGALPHNVNDVGQHLRLIDTAGNCFEASLKLKMRIGITEPFPWERTER